jgi:GMP reductase
MKEMLSYKDVVFLPNYSEVKSRDNLSTEIDFLGTKFKLPVLPANMACTVDFEWAATLGEQGYFYILHRFYDYKEICEWLNKKNYSKFPLSISIGVKDADYDFLENLSENNYKVDFVTIDVAHGHNIAVKNICKFFHHLPWTKKPKLIVGNVGSISGAKDLIEWGADAIKVGLSMGAACTTYNNTGVGTPMYSIIAEIKEAMENKIMTKVPIIADGQVREIGDACKALHAGAEMVMVGGMFAACYDSAAPINGNKKVFYGSASAKNKGEKKYVEGKESLIEISEDSTLDLLNKFEQGIKSSMSYAGASSPYELCKMEVRKRV